jgi:threonine/homoserine/homoserine lactone efflux protein
MPAKLIYALPNPLVVPIGVAIGILVAAPVGPVNVMCIQRSLQRGFWGGVAAGAGAVLGDGLIAFSAAMGVGAISGVIRYYRIAIQLVGGIALLIFGLRLYVTAPQTFVGETELAAPRPIDYFFDVSKSFFLTVTNPGAVLGLIAIFGGIGSFVELRGSIDALILVAAVASGSLGWWVLLSGSIGWVRHRFDIQELSRINRIAGIFLVAFGVLLVGEIVLHYARALTRIG